MIFCSREQLLQLILDHFKENKLTCDLESMFTSMVAVLQLYFAARYAEEYFPSFTEATADVRI